MIGLDWLAGSLGLLASYMVGNKNKNGWIVWILGSILTGYLAYQAGYYGLVTTSMIYVLLEIRGYIKHDC